VLDVGSGCGGFIPVIKQTFPDAKITGTDPDIRSLETARQKFPEVNFLEMEAEKLQFEDNYFDVATISMALHHLPGVKKGLKEMRRVVKPEGWIIINELISNNLSPAQEVHKMYHHFRSRIDRLTGIYHRKSFTKEAILQMLKSSNIYVQFFFEYKKRINLVEKPDDLEIRIKKMETMLEQIKGRPEYEIMKPEIEKFRAKASKYGFQPATNLVIVARKKI
ncbi:MAG: class I SAM-dependent methyltransferase, partial [Prolixibacteraceae bacterium]|nr:class I SAM-dependent methyltransferase [Prolixibacteraceae bacterium]